MIDIEPRDLTGAARAVITLKRGDCKWPFGDPRDANFRFCAEPTVETHVYCAAHKALARNETPHRRA